MCFGGKDITKHKHCQSRRETTNISSSLCTHITHTVVVCNCFPFAFFEFSRMFEPFNGHSCDVFLTMWSWSSDSRIYFMCFILIVGWPHNILLENVFLLSKKGHEQFSILYLNHILVLLFQLCFLAAYYTQDSSNNCCWWGLILTNIIGFTNMMISSQITFLACGKFSQSASAQTIPRHGG